MEQEKMLKPKDKEELFKIILGIKKLVITRAKRNKGFSAKSKGQFFYFRTNHNQC